MNIEQSGEIAKKETILIVKKIIRKMRDLMDVLEPNLDSGDDEQQKMTVILLLAIDESMRTLEDKIDGVFEFIQGKTTNGHTHTH